MVPVQLITLNTGNRIAMTEQQIIEIEKLKWERSCHMRYIERLTATIKGKKNPDRDFYKKAAGKILMAAWRIKQFEVRLFCLMKAPVAKFPIGGIIPGRHEVGNYHVPDIHVGDIR